MRGLQAGSNRVLQNYVPAGAPPTPVIQTNFTGTDGAALTTLANTGSAGGNAFVYQSISPTAPPAWTEEISGNRGLIRTDPTNEFYSTDLFTAVGPVVTTIYFSMVITSVAAGGYIVLQPRVGGDGGAAALEFWIHANFLVLANSGNVGHGLTFADGDKLHVLFRSTGTSYSARLWLNNNTQPSTPTATGTGGTGAAGQILLQVKRGPGQNSLYIDDFAVFDDATVTWPPPPTPSLVVLYDNFNRADGADFGALWDKRTPDGWPYAGISSNQAADTGSANNVGYLRNDFTPADPNYTFSQIDYLTAVAETFTPSICHDGTNVWRLGYEFLSQPWQDQLFLHRDGVQVAQFPTPGFTTSHWATLRIERRVDRITGIVDGKVIGVYVDPTPLTGTKIGFGFGTGNGACRQDNWQGGDLAVTTPVLTPLFTDVFTRADTTAPGLGAEWYAPSWAIQSNQATKTGGSGDFAVFQHDLGTPDVWVEATTTPNGQFNVVNLRRPSATDNAFGATGYMGFIDPGNGQPVIGKVVSGTYSDVQRGDAIPNFGSGTNYRLRLEAQGSSLRLYVDDILRVITTDTAVPTGNYVGMNSGNGTIDNFRCGVLAPQGVIQSVPGLWAWIDPDVAVMAGTNVNWVPNKGSSNAAAIATGTIATATVNGHKVLDLSGGTAGYLQTSQEGGNGGVFKKQELSCVVAYKATGAGPGSMFAVSVGHDDGGSGYSVTDAMCMRSGGTGIFPQALRNWIDLGTITGPVDTWAVAMCTIAPNGDSQVFCNTTTGSVVSNDNGAFRINAVRIGRDLGGIDPWWGQIGDVMVFNHVLTSTERTTIRTYLNAKYGMS
jgi:hypothetical protein